MTDGIWATYASAYSRILSNWEPYRELVRLCVLHMDPASSVLDMGCGTGMVVGALRREGRSIQGVDLEAQMLAEAISSNPDARFVRCDASRLPMRDDEFDGVVSNNVLYTVGAPDAYLSEARRVLRHGGRLTVSGPRPGYSPHVLIDHIHAEFASKGILRDLSATLEHFIECNAQLMSNHMPNLYEPADLVELLSRHGFSRVIESRDDLYCGQCYFVCVV